MPRTPAPSLVKVLEETRPAIARALAEAERELAELNDRRAELEALIARARSVLADDQPQARRAPAQRLTLHEAMERVLDDHQNRWMTVHEIADSINEHKLYDKRDRSPVEPSQIHARANKYPARFEKDGPRVRRIVP
jgi:DNA repair exonuclease SbcCD ATPase subunit